MAEYDQQISFPERELHPGKFAFLIFLTLMGLVLACIVLNKLVTRQFWAPYMGVLSDRLTAIELHREKIDTIFIGSSQVGSAINPVLLDDFNAAAGFKSSSFSLPLTGNTYAGTVFLLDRLEEISPPNLRYVFIEPRIQLVPNLQIVNNTMSNVYSSRVRYIFNYVRSSKSLYIARGNGDPIPRKLINIGTLLYVFGIHMSNLGVVHDIYTDTVVASSKGTDLWPSRGQSVPKDVSVLPPGVPAAPKLDRGYRQLNEVEVEALAEQISQIEKLGAEPVFFFPPSMREVGLQKAFREAALAHFPDIKVVDFIYNDESDHHPIYDDRKYWVDRGHLTETGQAYFSEFLSQRLREQLAQPASESSAAH